jgi:hypothetical protein
MALKRKKLRPWHDGDDPCAVCREPGSVCPDCGQAFCAACNVNPHVPPGHLPSAHRKAPEPVPETEEQRLQREIREMEQRLAGTPEDRLRKRHAQLTAQLKGTR